MGGSRGRVVSSHIDQQNRKKLYWIRQLQVRDAQSYAIFEGFISIFPRKRGEYG